MPRRQPKWEESAVAKGYFTNQYTGGPNMSNDGVTYSRLGGGLKRWRVTKRIRYYWRNAIMDADRATNWVNSRSYSAIEGRLVEFESLLGEPDPEVLRDALLQGIEDRREDVILEVDKQEISGIDDLEEQLAEADDGALLLIRRGDATVFVPLKTPTG